MEFLQNELYFKVADTDFELQSCYRLRYKVYCEEKRWISPSKFPDKMEIDEYDEKAVHVIAMNQDFQVVGLMRILYEKDFDRLPYLDHPSMRENPYRTKNMAELSRFVITADESRYYVLRGLLRGIYQVCRKLDIENTVFVAEPSLPRLLTMFKYYTEPVSSPIKYYGGLTQIAVINIPYMERRWRESYPQYEKFNTSDMLMMTPETEKELMTPVSYGAVGTDSLRS